MDLARSRSLGQGEKLCKEGDPSAELYWIRTGTILILKGSVIVGQVGALSFVGEIGVVLGQPRSMTLIAKTPCVLDIYDGGSFMAKLSLNSDHGVKFLRGLSERFELIRNRVTEYHNAFLDECLKILAVLISEKKMTEKKLQFTDMKNIRRDVEVMLAQNLTRRDAVEDFSNLHKAARSTGVSDKFQAGVTNRFKSFAPMDLKTFRVQRPETFPDLQTAARDVVRKILDMSDQLVACQSLGMARLESELILIEETLPFDAREQILKELMLGKYAKGSLDDFRRQITEFDRSVKALAEEPGHKNMPLASVAKRFELDREYIGRLQDKWKEYLKS
ncbi:cyclic nucleotide-binding domain-containing protein [bacterium]|nr:cyclic nucleotide-binding domain-containing protein [bacterium]